MVVKVIDKPNALPPLWQERCALKAARAQASNERQIASSRGETYLNGQQSEQAVNNLWNKRRITETLQERLTGLENPPCVQINRAGAHRVKLETPNVIEGHIERQ